MVSLDDLRDLTLYKKQFFLPIDTKDKSHGSAIMLMTPNYQSSMIAMTSPYTVNKRYFMSYYIEKAIMRYIKNESIIPVMDHGEYIFEQALTSSEKKEMSKSEFGIPEERKYPLNDEKHVLLAIKFFNHVEDKYEKKLASNIIKKIKEFNMAHKVHVGKNNRFLPYWQKSGLSGTELTESVDISVLDEENYLTTIGKNIKYRISNLASNKALSILDKKVRNTRLTILVSGNREDINATKPYINSIQMEECFTKMNKPIPKEVKIIIVDNSDVEEQFNEDEGVFTLYTPKAFKDFHYKFSYQEYVKYTMQLYAVYTLKPSYYKKGNRIFDSIAEPAAILLSGIADKDIEDSSDKVFRMEKVFKRIIKDEGMNAFIDTIASNDLDKIYSYVKIMANEKYQDKSFYEAYSLIREEGEEISVEDPIPESIKKIQRMGFRLKRKIRNGSVYKLNKIKRDIEQSMQAPVANIQTPDVSTSTPAPTTSEAPVEESISMSLVESYSQGDYVSQGDFIYLFEDSNKYDAQLRKALFRDRFKSDREVLAIYNKVKSDLPFIRYAYTKIPRYQNKNLFIDMCYYNESFFRNVDSLNTDDKANTLKIFKMYMELLERLLKNENFAGYKKKTVFIPVLDWRHNNSTKMWMYREDINPISAIYHMMKFDKQALQKVFGDKDVVFLGAKNYFKINFSKTDFNQGSNVSKFLRLINRIITLGYNSPADPDPEGTFDDSPKGIAMSIIDKVEKSQNITIDNVSKVDSLPTDADIFNKKPEIISTRGEAPAIKKNAVDKSPDKVDDTVKDKRVRVAGKGLVNQKVINVAKSEIERDIGIIPNTSKAVNDVSPEDKKDSIVDAIVKASKDSSDEDSAIRKLDNDDFKEMIIAIQNDSPDNVRVDASRASAVIDAQTEFHKKEVNNKSVQDLLNKQPDPTLKETALPIASVNEEWKNLKFINFDKNYDLDSDIMKMLDAMQYWTYPVAVRDISVRDNSTSEDYVDLWTIECIDSFKTKFTLKVDVPKFINGSNFLKLRGNEKALMIQSALLPLIKTGSDECQIIGTGGYNKIFVRKFGGRKGQSMPGSSKLMRALNKYTKSHSNITITYGDSSRICSKYNLPMDYIDMSRIYNTIEFGSTKIYFNQDELRKEYKVDDRLGVPIGVSISSDGKQSTEKILYFDGKNPLFSHITSYVASLISMEYPDFGKIYDGIVVSGNKFTYSRASILDVEIPVVILGAYLEGLVSVMNKAGIKYEFQQKLEPSIRRGDNKDYIRFSDGILVYDVTYSSSMLMNGLKECDTDSYSIRDVNNRRMYLEFLDNFGGQLKSDGIENSYDCMIDPITKEILEKYKLPTDYVSLVIYASNVLCDNKYVKHIDQTGRRWRRKELIAGYFYKALTTSYQTYASNNRRNRNSVKMSMKQSAIIDLIVSKDPSTSDLSVNSVLNDVECANTVTNKGLVGMNVARGYTVDTRRFDESMLNVFGMDTGFSANVGINRQATIDANVEGGRGFVKGYDNSKDLSTVSTFTMTEAVTPFGCTHDDPSRTLMTYVQTSKHMVRCDVNDPTLITTGADEALAYMSSDIFAYKAKKDGTVVELVQEGFNGKNYMVIEYADGKHEFIDLSEEVKKNSDGGYYVPLKLDTELKVGQKFKENEVLAYDKSSFSRSLGESGNLASTIGTLAKVAIINTDEGFEDSAIVTESFAKKIATSVIMDITTKVEKGSNIFVYKEVGDPVMEGDTLFATQADFDDDVVNSLLRNLTMDMEQLSELGRNPVKCKYTGIVEAIKIYRTCDLEKMSPSLREFVTKHEDKIRDIKSVYEKYNLDTGILPPTDKVYQVGKTKNLDDAVLIIYYIKYKDNVSAGDKIVNYKKAIVQSNLFAKIPIELLEHRKAYKCYNIRMR